MRSLDKKEAEKLHVQNVGPSKEKAAEYALLNAFEIGIKFARNGLKNALFRFIETVITKMARNGSQKYLLKRSIESCAQWLTFTDAFARYALMYSWFVRPMAKPNRKLIVRKKNEFEQEAKPIDSPFPWSELHPWFQDHWMMKTTANRQKLSLLKQKYRKLLKSGKNWNENLRSSYNQGAPWVFLQYCPHPIKGCCYRTFWNRNLRTRSAKRYEENLIFLYLKR